MELYLVRHGKFKIDDGCDPALGEAGKAQAELTGKKLIGEEIEEVYVSPLRRTIETAKIICEILGIDFKVWYKIVEKDDYSNFNGMFIEDIKLLTERAEFHEDMIFNYWWKEIGSTEEENFQRGEEVKDRIMNFYNQGKNKVLLIGHGTFWGILVGRLLQVERGKEIRFSQNNCCISQIEILDESVKLRYLNRVGHLPAELVT